MYKRKFKQLTLVDDFYLPFGGKLNAENRWVKLSNAIPWFAAEEIYANNFTASNSSPALSVRSALGSLIIKETLSITDEETVSQIQENPYLQYFIGFKRFQNEAPFDSSLMTHFRKRITSIDIANVSENLRKQYRELLEKREQLLQKQADSSSACAPGNSASEEPQGIEISPETLLLEAGPEPLPVVTEAVSDEPPTPE